MIKINCDNCNKEFSKYPCQINDTVNFCSIECRTEYWNKNGWGKDKRHIVICDFCGKDVLKKDDQIGKYNHQFCNRKCHQLWKLENDAGDKHPLAKPIYVNCSQCGKEVRVTPVKLSQQDNVFCSRKCQGMWNKNKWRNNRESHPSWNGGLTSFNNSIRLMDLYKQWKDACFIRDDYTCRCCGQIGGDLHVHHIKEFKELVMNLKDLDQARSCSELWDITNGITLCVDCHKLEHETLKEIN